MMNNSIKKSKGPRSKKKKVIFSALFIIIAIATPFLIYWIMQLSLNTTSPMVVVVSGSMEPELYKGDLVFLYGKEPADIKNGTILDKNGDVIVFDAHGVWTNNIPPEPVIHRVVNKKLENGTWYFKTKGDANSVIDPGWVPDTNIIGVVVGKIPWIGWVKIFLTESNLLIPLLIIIMGILIISLIWDFVKKEEDKEKSSQTEEIENTREFINNSEALFE